MGTLVPSMHQGNLRQADNTRGVLLSFSFIFYFIKKYASWEKKSKFGAFGVLCFFFFFSLLLRLLCFILGLAICLLLFPFGQVPGFGGTVSGWFAPAHSSPLFRYCWGDPAALAPGWMAERRFCWWFCCHCSFPVVSPASFPWQPAVTAAGLPRQPSCSGQHRPPFQPPSPLHRPLLTKALLQLWLRVNNMP